jgi:glycosyltransferase involved in cell wall biosynthesis
VIHTSNLYVTGDAIGTATGGGKVTHHESRALAACGDAEIWQFPNEPRPWGPDLAASAQLEARSDYRPARAHFYSGTFTRTIEVLKERGTVVTYTAAAHDVSVSRQEHEQIGIPFDYPHLTDPDQWRRYVRGYLIADLVVCPSTYSKQIMQRYGCSDVAVIPHGCDPPEQIASIPSRFVVGYLGQPGPDKGLRHLLAAWDLWGSDHPDALLVIAGRGTQHLRSWVRDLCRGGSYYVRGEVDDPRDLYDACAAYVQPSASEGFGCEVLEARAHGRPVICTDGAGARDFANVVVPACDPAAIATAIDHLHDQWSEEAQSLVALANPQHVAEQFSWSRIRGHYEEIFRS